MAIFEGAGVAIITPMKENFEVDYDAFGEILEDQIAKHTDAIIVCGTTGESSTMSHEEHLECVKYTVEKVNKRIPVIAGTGSNCTETAVYLSKGARNCGADGVLLVTPYYNKATQRGMIEHFTRIAQAIDIPAILYNIPGRTGCNLAPKTVAELVKSVDNIVGMKEASGDLSQIIEMMELTQGDIDLYSGNDDQIVPLLSVGGKGVISVLSNILPQETHDMVAAYLAGDHKTSLALQIKYLPLIRALFSEVNPIPVKKAMNLMGMAAGSLRLPLTEMEPEHANILAQEMKKVGIALV